MDLGGKDALRKLLILAREAGVKLEAKDVKVEPIIPSDAFKGTVEEFYTALEAEEQRFVKMSDDAAAKGQRLRFVAYLQKNGKAYEAGIGIRSVAPEHPAYYLRGTENAIIVRSAFHPYPLVIQGPGEGAREAASSILNDILR
jgi:aspartokinase/homoserine dehydrogenase 1